MESHSKLIFVIFTFLRKIIGFIIRNIWVQKTTGIENIPKKGSAILAFNHQSFFDFLCFTAVSPRNVHFLAAEKFFYHRLWKYLMIFTGQIKVERDSHEKAEVHERVRKHVSAGTLIGIFPEGTRSPHEFEMLKAYTGIAKYALEHKLPIIPVGIKGTYTILPKDGGKVKFGRIVDINIGKPIHFIEHWDKHDQKEIRTLVTETVIKEIEKLSGKTYKHYELLK